ncbi:hypothetical protein M405DRAFT_816109, partial [Rhizopogon salebrosus TDB-379]
MVPADEIDIEMQERNITSRHPAYETRYVGVLYATGARQPVLVHIPLKLGVPGFRSSRDLEISYWVNQRDSKERVSFGSD